MSKSKIEWTDRVWNPVRGCSRISAGCEHCYAERQSARFSDEGQYAHGFVQRTKSGPRWTGVVELIEDKLLDPIRWRGPSRVFVNSMSDLFHEKLAEEAIDRVFAVMGLAGRHTFQVLTKRAERMQAYVSSPDRRERVEEAAWKVLAALDDREGSSHASPDRREFVRDFMGNHRLPGWPFRNAWLGVSAEDQESAQERVPLLLNTPAFRRFVSAEPLLGPINFRALQDDELGAKWNGFEAGGLHWIIVGGESGPGARPCDAAWVRSIVKQCKAWSVAVFVKQLGACVVDSNSCDAAGLEFPWPMGARTTPGYPTQIVLDHSKGGHMHEWPEDLRVREFPA